MSEPHPDTTGLGPSWARGIVAVLIAVAVHWGWTTGLEWWLK